MISDAALSAKAGALLDGLYVKRLQPLDKLTLNTLMSKNPYLYKALGLGKASDLIDQMLLARVSNSDETIFGNDFFEPLAMFTAEQYAQGSGGTVQATVGAGAGQDVAIQTTNAYLAISVKSGINIFNSQSEKGQSTEFGQMQARLKKLNLMFRPIIGYGYGRKKEPKVASPVERLAGQTFWALLSGETEYYLRIARAMTPFASSHAEEFKHALEQKNNRLLLQFMLNFVDGAGAIDWDKVVAYNRGSTTPKRLKVPSP